MKLFISAYLSAVILLRSFRVVLGFFKQIYTVLFIKCLFKGKLLTINTINEQCNYFKRTPPPPPHHPCISPFK